MIRLFKREGVEQVVMAGKVNKAELMHHPWRLLHLFPDLRTLRFWYFGRRPDNRDDDEPALQADRDEPDTRRGLDGSRQP